MTAPERKATVSPSLRLCFAAAAVRALALVAIFMPNQPHRADSRPATGTPIIVCQGWSFSAASAPRNSTSTAKTPATTLYCRTR